jgi:hypothetical protein
VRGLCSSITKPTHLHFSLLWQASIIKFHSNKRVIGILLGIWVHWTKGFQGTEFCCSHKHVVEHWF